MFIRLQKSPTSTRVQVYLAESYRDSAGRPRHRTVHRFGELGELQAGEPGVLDRLRREAAAMPASRRTDDRRLVEVDCARPRGAADRSVCYGNFILDGLWKALDLPALFQRLARRSGTSVDAGQVARMLVQSRVVAPASKLATWNARDSWFDPFDCEPQDVYKALDLLDAWSTRIQAHLHRRVTATVGRDTSLVFYDVTNYWFDTDQEDGFRMNGASKEHRPDPIVQMGLLIDRAGVPVAYRLFPGNTHDATTLVPVLDDLKARYGLARIVVVADKALNSGSNLDALAGHGDGWVVSQKVRGRVAADITTHLDDPDGWRVTDDATFASKSYVRTRVLPTGPVLERVVLMWSKANADRDKAKRARLRASVQSLIDHPGSYDSSNKHGRKRYIAETLVTGDGELAGKHLSFNQTRWDADEALDGYYAIITSETSLTDDQVINHYRGLARIEESFRVIKPDLQGRPVYVRTPAHVNAHFLVCFLALTLTRLIQHATGWTITATQTKHSLATATCTPLEKGLWTIDETTDAYKTIEHAWGVSLPVRYATIETIRQYKRSITAATRETLHNHNTKTEP